MHFLKTNFNEDPNLGLYGFATDSYCLIGNMTTGKSIKKIKKVLKVKILRSSVLGTDFVGIFVAGNSSGIVVTKILEEFELDEIEKLFDSILVIDSYFTAIGNLILMNDQGAIISPLLKKEKNKIEKFFDIPCVISTIAKTSIVGKTAAATNVGCVVHPKTTEKEMKVIKDTLKVNVDVGTVGYGSHYPGAGIIANSFGFVVPEKTSGPEMGRMTEVFGFLNKK